MKKRFARPVGFAIFVALAALLIVIDRATKVWALGYLGSLEVTGPVPFIPPLLDFWLTFNYGAAFGMFNGAAFLFLAVALVVSVSMALYLLFTKQQSALMLVSFACIVAGALGNAIDRLRYGKVVDFIHTMFIDFPVFNVADCCITIGVVLLILVLILDRRSLQGHQDA